MSHRDVSNSTNNFDTSTPQGRAAVGRLLRHVYPTAVTLPSDWLKAAQAVPKERVPVYISTPSGRISTDISLNAARHCFRAQQFIRMKNRITDNSILSGIFARLKINPATVDSVEEEHASSWVRVDDKQLPSIPTTTSDIDSKIRKDSLPLPIDGPSYTIPSEEKTVISAGVSIKEDPSLPLTSGLLQCSPSKKKVVHRGGLGSRLKRKLGFSGRKYVENNLKDDFQLVDNKFDTVTYFTYFQKYVPLIQELSHYLLGPLAAINPRK